MSTYTAKAVRWTHGWEVHIDGLGVTQCRTLDHARQQACDYIQTLTGESDSDVSVTVDLGNLTETIAQARRATAEASRAAEDAAKRSRDAVRELRDSGLSVSDTAYVMGVSRGRISQLVGR